MIQDQIVVLTLERNDTLCQFLMSCLMVHASLRVSLGTCFQTLQFRTMPELDQKYHESHVVQRVILDMGYIEVVLCKTFPFSLELRLVLFMAGNCSFVSFITYEWKKRCSWCGYEPIATLRYTYYYLGIAMKTSRYARYYGLEVYCRIRIMLL